MKRPTPRDFGRIIMGSPYDFKPGDMVENVVSWRGAPMGNPMMVLRRATVEEFVAYGEFLGNRITAQQALARYPHFYEVTTD